MKLNKADGSAWNNGDLSRLDSPRKRATARYETHLSVKADELLATLARRPGQAGHWLEDWGPRTNCGPASGGCDSLWTERKTGADLFGDAALPTHWYTTCCDPAAHRFHAVLMNPERAIGKLEIALRAEATGTVALFELTYSALSKEGNLMFDEGLADRLQAQLVSLATALQRSIGADRSSAPSPSIDGFQARRASARIQATMKGDADEVFALACPVMELDWIEDWQFDLIHSVSGKNEHHNIFLEPSSAVLALRSPRALTYWYTTRWEPEAHRFHAVLLTGDFMVGKWEFEGERQADGRISGSLQLTYTALNERGNAIIAEAGFEGRVHKMLQFVLASLRCYVETGKMYRVPHTLKLRLAMSVIGSAIGRHVRRLHDRAHAHVHTASSGRGAAVR